MSKRWRDKAQSAVICHLLEYEAQALLLDEPIDYLQALKDISKNKYPFAWKRGHAYKSWLVAIKWTKERINEGRSPSEISRIDWLKFNRDHQANFVLINQLDLFGAS